MAAVVLIALAVPVIAWALVNGAILGASLLARATVADERPAPADGVGHFRRVDDHLWRGAAPTAEGYRQLAALGVRTVIDLRAESPHQPGSTGRRLRSSQAEVEPFAGTQRAIRGGGRLEGRSIAATAAGPSVAPARATPPGPVASAGLELIRIPLDDGHAPTSGQVQQFLDAVRDAPGPVFVHCNAGVGRTGSMSAAYLVTTGQADPEVALQRSLAVGPPSLEQVAFMRTLTTDGPSLRHPAVDTISRLADAPRKLWGKLV